MVAATPDQIEALLDETLRTSTAGATEALYLAQDSALTRFATNRIHQNVREHDATLQVRVIDRDRIGVASTNVLDAGGIRHVVERAIAIAERHPGARLGTVEIRPVMELGNLPKSPNQ